MNTRTLVHVAATLAVILAPIALEARALAHPLVRARIVHTAPRAQQQRTAGAHSSPAYTCAHNAYRSIACTK